MLTVLIAAANITATITTPITASINAKPFLPLLQRSLRFPPLPVLRGRVGVGVHLLPLPLWERAGVRGKTSSQSSFALNRVTLITAPSPLAHSASSPTTPTATTHPSSPP